MREGGEFNGLTLEQAKISLWSSKFSQLECPTCFWKTGQINELAMLSRVASSLLP